VADGEPGPRPTNVRWWIRLLDPTRAVDVVTDVVSDQVLPAWRRVSRGEPRLAVSIGVFVAIALEASLPDRVAYGQRWATAIVAFLLLVGIVLANPSRLNRPSKTLRAATLLLVALLSIGNMTSGARLIIDLVNAEGIRDPGRLLLTGGSIWFTNVILFALWYWEFDRGGPVARALAPRAHPDFLFPQMTAPAMAPDDWKAGFTDYFYMSFTNATAFSPTDVMPLSHWAKLTMLVQSAISLMLAALVIARAVNILR
jgi:uncharacterized membrane protein